MKNLAIVNKFNDAFGKVGFKVKKHSPEILVVTGIVGVVASAVMACKATMSLNPILDEARADIETIHNNVENPSLPVPVDPNETKKELAKVYLNTAVDITKLYAPSVILGGLSITGILASNNILRKRNVALAAAYATIDKGFKEYRGRVVERFGEAVDRELKYNLKQQKVEEKVVDAETGKEKKVKKTINVADLNDYSSYARFFDIGNDNWNEDHDLRLFFLRAEQNYANERLKARGHLFLNEVYERLGIPKTPAGQIVGWIYDPENPFGDNFVDFGIYDVHKRGSRDFVNGYEEAILLDFNVDGNIWEQMNTPEYRAKFID